VYSCLVLCALISIAEDTDLADVLPEVAQHLKQRFDSYKKPYHPPSTHVLADNVGYCQAALRNGGFTAPWLDE
jgi:hypothetical protein